MAEPGGKGERVGGSGGGAVVIGGEPGRKGGWLRT